MIRRAWAKGRALREIAGRVLRPARLRGIFQKGTKRVRGSNIAFGTLVFVDERWVGTVSESESACAASEGVASESVIWVISASLSLPR